MCWGKETAGSKTVTFPVSFSATPAVLMTRNDSSSGGTNANFNWLRGLFAYSVSTTGFTINTFNGEAANRSWLAIGKWK